MNSLSLLVKWVQIPESYIEWHINESQKKRKKKTILGKSWRTSYVEKINLIINVLKLQHLTNLSLLNRFKQKVKQTNKRDYLYSHRDKCKLAKQKIKPIPNEKSLNVSILFHKASSFSHLFFFFAKSHHFLTLVTLIVASSSLSNTLISTLSLFLSISLSLFFKLDLSCVFVVVNVIIYFGENLLKTY